MGSSFCSTSTTSVFIASIVLMSFMAMPLSHAFDISSICSKTSNALFCSSVLNSNPLVTKSLLHSLAHATVDLAHSNATSTRDHLVQWQNSTDNLILRQRYTSCLSNYNDAIADFQQAKEHVRLGDYNGLRDAASGAMGEMNGCGENFRQPPADPSTLYQDTQDVLGFSSVILVISNMLLRSS